MNFKGLDYYQKQYNQMVAIAKQSFDDDIDLDPRFERELIALTKLVKSLGGKV